MRKHKRSWLTFVVAGAVFTLLPSHANAYFERLALSSRVYAMGGAYVSAADDPSAVVLNPAGLAQIYTPSVLSTISEPYGLSELRETFLAAALPTRVVSIGLAWHSFGLDGVTSENLFSLALGRDIIRTSQDASLSVGAGIDIARVAYSGELHVSETVLTGTVSMLLRPFPFIGAGYTVRHLGKPSLDFGLPSWSNPYGLEPGAARLEVTHTFGFAYHWERTFSILYERERGQDERWRNRIGVEVRAGDHLRLRSGLAGDDVAGGVGVAWSNVTVDVGVTSHGALGLSYLVSAGISLPTADKEKDEGW